MIDLKELQKKILKNKVNKWFNISNINLEFNLIYWEIAEAFESYYKDDWNIWEELADVVIYILWVSEILWIDLWKEIIKKIDINEVRKYKKKWNWHIKI